MRWILILVVFYPFKTQLIESLKSFSSILEAQIRFLNFYFSVNTHYNTHYNIVTSIILRINFYFKFKFSISRSNILIMMSFLTE